MGEQSDESLLVFPTEYPIKVLGRRQELCRADIDALVRSHVPTLLEEQILERESSAGNFVSITYLIIAESRDQVTTLVSALLKAEGVVMVL
jgi:putative lipoic acid-binding regulatory protein